MKNLFNKIIIVTFIGIVTLVILGIAGLVTLKIMYPAEKLRGIAEQKIQKLVNRKVTIKNVDIGFKGIKISDVIIFEKTEDDKECITIKDFYIRLKIMPMLFKKLSANKVIIQEPVVYVNRYQDNTLNLFDLFKKDEAGANTSIKHASLKGALAFSFLVSNIYIKNGKLIFNDYTEHNLSHVLDDIYLDISDVSMLRAFTAKGKLNFNQDMNPSLKKPLNGSLDFNFKLNILERRLEIVSCAAAINNLSFTAKGIVEQKYKKTMLKLNVTSQKAPVQDIIKQIENVYPVRGLLIFGSPPININVTGDLDLVNLNGSLELRDTQINYKDIFKKDKGIQSSVGYKIDIVNRKLLKLNNIVFKCNGNQLHLKGDVNFKYGKPGIKLYLDAGRLDTALLDKIVPASVPYELKGIMGVNAYYINTKYNKKTEASLMLNGLGLKTDLGIFKDLYAKFFINKNSFKITNLRTALDGKKMYLDMDIDNFNNPKGSFTLTADYLDLDRLLNKLTRTGEAESVEAEQDSLTLGADHVESESDDILQEKETGVRDAEDKEQSVNRPVPILLPAYMRNARLEGNINIKRLLIKNVKCSDVSSKVLWEDKILRLDPVKLKLYGGGGEGKLSLTLLRLDQIDYLVSCSIYKCRAENLFKDLGVLEDQVYGKLSSEIKLRGRNKEWDKTYSRGLFNITKGRFDNIQFLNDLSRTVKVGSLGRPKFSRLAFTYELKNGIFKTDDFVVKGFDVDVTAGGNADIIKNKLDFKAEAKFGPHINKGMLAKIISDKDGNLIHKFKITGTFEKPKYTYILDNDVVNRIAEKVINEAAEFLDKLQK
ncbi:AsmA family protein [bacterium]